MNTKINYLYCDADNYKQQNSCVINGILTPEQQDAIMATLDDGEYFIPRAVGLPETRFGPITSADHCWFRIEEDAFEEVDEAPTLDIAPEALVAAFQRYENGWPDAEYAV